MHKIISLAIIGLFFCSSLSVLALSTNSVLTTTHAIEFSQPQVRYNKNEVSISIKQATSKITNPGHPMLPKTV